MDKLDRPLKPDEVGIVQHMSLPPEVFNAVNRLIAAHWSGSTAVVLQKDIVNAIIHEWNQRSQPGYPTTITSDEIYKQHYLDFEEAYRSQGWSVEYDKPAYNENYDPFFTFKRKK